MKANIFIPTKINVGFQKRKDTYTGKLAYVIYFDEKGKLRKETSWQGWRDEGIPKRVAKFEKVTYGQFEKDWLDTFNVPELDTATKREIESIYEAINLPARATKFSAGYDFASPLTFTLNPGETIKIPTGIRCGMNTDWVLMIYPRSGLGFKYQICLANTIGVVDADYYFSNNEGHIFVKLVNRGDKSVHINPGDAFAQGIFMEYGITEDDRVETSRNGGFGSTDKNK